MTRLGALPAVIVALLCTALSGCTVRDAEGVHVLTYATPYPPMHPFSRADQRWMEFVEKQSDGRLRIKPFWGGALLSSDQSVVEIRHGVADIGLITPIYMRGGMHASRAQAGFYGGVKTMEDQVAIFKCLAREFPVFRQELQGLHVLALQGGNFPGVLTRSKPVRSLDDLKGLRLRTQSETIDVLRRLGADPVDMPMGEVYPALAKGVIDGVVAPVDTLRALHFAEVASYFTELHISRGSYPARAISARVWAALPDDLRSILTGSQAVWERALMDEVLKGQEAGYLFGREHGVEFIAVSAEDQRRFDEVSRQSAVDRAGSLRAYGIDGDAILFRVQSLIRRRAEGYAMTCHDDAHEGVLQ